MLGELEPGDIERLDQQRRTVRLMLAKIRGLREAVPHVSASDLQEIVDAKLYGAQDEHMLQCMGVCVGDLICEKEGFRWVVVDDKYGRGLTVRYRNARMTINAVTIVQKRVQSGEEWCVADLIEGLPRIMLEQLTRQGST